MTKVTLIHDDSFPPPWTRLSSHPVSRKKPVLLGGEMNISLNKADSINRGGEAGQEHYNNDYTPLVDTLRQELSGQACFINSPYTPVIK